MVEILTHHNLTVVILLIVAVYFTALYLKVDAAKNNSVEILDYL